MSTQAQPSISVVIPCFNYAKYVGQAIESALSQTYGNKQVIVVNDGSTDGSLEVISRYLGRVHLVDQRHQGSIAAYNHGFAAATGDVIIFLDADDLLDLDALSQVAEVWSPACVKVQYDLCIIDRAGADLGRRFCNFPKDYDAARVREAFRRTGTYRWPVTLGNAYSRWFIEQMLPLEIAHGPDGTLNTVAPVYGDVVTIPRPLGSYRIHGANAWSSNGADLGRLPERIRHRKTEEAFMRRHATARGVVVPEESLLDHELASINHRFMALRLGLSYDGDNDDSTTSLFGRASRALYEERLPLRLSLGHVLWFGALSIASRSAARRLIHLRFNRNAIAGTLADKVSRLLSRRNRRAARASFTRRAAGGLGDE
jgi:glycosyltransferase involved in cell wall biosynthesis